MFLDCTAGQAYDFSDFLVCHIQHTAQDQNGLRLCGQTGKGFGYQLIADRQVAAVGAEYVAVAGILVYGAELVQFRLRHGAERGFTGPAAFLLPQIVYGPHAGGPACRNGQTGAIQQGRGGWVPSSHPLSLGDGVGGSFPFR